MQAWKVAINDEYSIPKNSNLPGFKLFIASPHENSCIESHGLLSISLDVDGGPNNIPSRHLPTTKPQARSTSSSHAHCRPTTPPPTLFTVSGVGVSTSETRNKQCQDYPLCYIYAIYDSVLNSQSNRNNKWSSLSNFGQVFKYQITLFR